MGRQEPRLELLQQDIHRQQCMNLGRVGPQPGQRMRCGGALSHVEFVAARLGVPDDRGVESIAQLSEIALERGRRCLEGVEQLAARDSPVVAKQPLDPVEAFDPIQDARFAKAALLVAVQAARAMPDGGDRASRCQDEVDTAQRCELAPRRNATVLETSTGGRVEADNRPASAVGVLPAEPQKRLHARLRDAPLLHARSCVAGRDGA